jgi:hypothetical protein
MADKKEKNCSASFIIGIGIIIFFATIDWVSSCNQKRKEANTPVIAVTFTTIKDLGSKVVEDPNQRISIHGYIGDLSGDPCNYPTAERCNVQLVSADPKSTDIPIHLWVLMTSEDKPIANAVIYASEGALNLFTNDKQRLTSHDLVLVTGHLVGIPSDSGAAIAVDTLESAP